MKIQGLQNSYPQTTAPASQTKGDAGQAPAFDTWLSQTLAAPTSPATQTAPMPPVAAGCPPNFPTTTADLLAAAETNPAQATAVYRQHQTPTYSPPPSAWEQYRDEQLLSNPGGDAYFLDQAQTPRAAEADSFWGQLGKDLSDAAENMGNFFQNLLFGAETHYRDENNVIQTAQQRGVVGSLVDFFTDLGSALSFGAWRPDGETAPQGLGERTVFAFNKLKEALLGDLGAGVVGSVNRAGEDLLLAGWNLIEVVPDATIGALPGGKPLVSTLFDNGQVVVDYLTDILPAGEAWLRVHSMDLGEGRLPIFYNLQGPDDFRDDPRWGQVRNTPFRKTIETIGALVADMATLYLAGQLTTGSSDRH